MKNSSDQREKLLELVCAATPPTRLQFLNKACEIVDQSKSAAVLWLYDADPQQNLFLLDRFVWADWRNRTFDAASVFEGVYCIRQRDFNESNLDLHPQIRQWCETQNFHPTSHIFPLKIIDVETKVPTLLGILQILSEQAPPDGTLSLLHYLANALAQSIVTRRATRLSQLSESFQEPNNVKTSNAWLRFSADKLRQFTRAELCLVYQQQSDLTYQAVAGANRTNKNLDVTPLVAGECSRVRQIAEAQREIVRRRDFEDGNERFKVFGTEEYDEDHVEQLSRWLESPLKTIAAAPVIVDKHAIGVIVLYNKTKQLAKLFSETDVDALDRVTKFLSSAIPAASSNLAIDQLSSIKMGNLLGNSKSTTQEIYQWLEKSITGIGAAALFRKGPHDDYAGHWLGGENWFEDTEPASPLREDMYEFSSEKVEKHYRRFIRIPGLQIGTAVLALGFRKSYLAKHELRMVRHLCAEISHVLRAEEATTLTLNDLVQVRHVIRATLNGIGNISPLVSRYRRFASTNTLPTLLNSASFRKGLERTELFYLRTSVLLEEAKFLLEDISSETLRIERHSISEIVSESCVALRCSADYRDIAIQFHDKLQSHQREVDVDRNLMQIVLFNLVDNAIKYGFRNRDVIVDLTTIGGNWVASVTDHGLYIPLEDHERIFRRFVRRPKGPHAAQRLGTGLGLAVAKSIVEAHHGQLKVVSTIQRTQPTLLAETTFSVTIPRLFPRASR